MNDHSWRASLPADLPVGSHLISVQTTEGGRLINAPAEATRRRACCRRGSKLLAIEPSFRKIDPGGEHERSYDAKTNSGDISFPRRGIDRLR